MVRVFGFHVSLQIWKTSVAAWTNTVSDALALLGEPSASNAWPKSTLRVAISSLMKECFTDRLTIFVFVFAMVFFG